MTLRLSVVSEHGLRLGPHATKVFGVHGGSIGRGSDNDWILPDPERYLSGKHARIDFRAGNYVLIDTSSNGTYINGAQVPLGKYHDYTLKDGDYVRLGEYEMLVSIDQSTDFPPDDSAIVAYDGRAPNSAVRKATADDLGADLDLSQLLEPSDTMDLRGPRGRSYGQSVQPDWIDQPPKPLRQNTARTGTHPAAATPPPVPAASAPPLAAPLAPTPTGGAPEEARDWHLNTRPLRVPDRAPERDAPGARDSLPRPPVPVLSEGDLDLGLAAFCRGAGIDPRNINPAARGVALQLAGQLLRESLLGLLDLSHSGNELRNRFRIPPAPGDIPESALNFSRGVDDALIRLFNNSSTRASSVDAVRDNFKELKAHNSAALAAMRSAFEAFIERLEPNGLEERFEGAAKRGVFGSPNRARYWDLYAEMFPGLVQRPADGFPHVYTEAFVKAFETQLRTLIAPRRGAFGADRQGPSAPDGKVAGDY